VILLQFELADKIGNPPTPQLSILYVCVCAALVRPTFICLSALKESQYSNLPKNFHLGATLNSN
jgi:hypothetical protein